MEVLGRRSKAGIWCEETRRSSRAVRGASDVAIINERWRNAEDKGVGYHSVQTWPETDGQLHKSLDTNPANNPNSVQVLMQTTLGRTLRYLKP